MRKIAATLIALLATAPALAQTRAGPGPAPGPWQQAYPDLYYNYGGIRLPFLVPGGSKGPGTVNAAGLYLNGISVTSIPVTAANMPAFTGDCSSAAGTTTLTCTKTQGAAFAPSATTDTTNANNVTSGTLPAARLPAPGAATRGGVLSASAPTNQFQTGIAGALGDSPTFAQPAFANLSGVLLAAQVPAFTGDFTCSGLTCGLVVVNGNTGSFGGASSVPVLTLDAKGRVTAASATPVVAPAGTLSGATLAAGVVNTSITSVGTIATGVWNGTAINPTYIVTGTSGAAIGLLNTNKTDSGNNTYSGANVDTGSRDMSGASSVKVPTAATADTSTLAASTQNVTNKINAAIGALPLGQGFRNRLANGDMSIDQRNGGASQTITAGAALAYTVDRWYGYSTGANMTGQRVAGTGSTQYRYQLTGASGVTSFGFGQRIEAANSYDWSGQGTVFGVDLADTLLTSITWTAYYANTADTFGTLASPTRTQIATGTCTVSSSISRCTGTVAIPTAATTGVEIVFSGGAQTSGTFTIGNVQWEMGSTTTAFERLPTGIQMMACQRYFFNAVNWGVQFTGGSANAVSSLGGPAFFPVPMRIAPSVSGVTYSASNAQGGSFVTPSRYAISFSAATSAAGGGSFAVTAGFFTAEL